MAQAVSELFLPVHMAANATAVLSNGPCGFGSFFCTAGGTFTLQDGSGNTIVDPISLTIGQTIPGGYECLNGAKVVLSSGCAGTASYCSVYE